MLVIQLKPTDRAERYLNRDNIELLRLEAVLNFISKYIDKRKKAQLIVITFDIDCRKEDSEYYFKSNVEFETMIKAGEMLEYATVFGNKYGTPRKPVEFALSNGRDVLFDVDWQGGTQIRNSSLNEYVVSIFILPPSIYELENRLIGRGQDSVQTVNDRMIRSKEEISHWSDYDYVLVNSDIETVQKEIKAIITSERIRRTRRDALRELRLHKILPILVVPGGRPGCIP